MATLISPPEADPIPWPAVIDVYQSSTDATAYTLTMDHQIVPGQWTTIRANVEMAAAPYAAIRSDPLDRVDLAFLPGDANGDNTVNTADYDRIEDVLDETYPENLSLHDINRDGVVTNTDKNRLQELLQGTNTTRAWNNYTLPAQP